MDAPGTPTNTKTVKSPPTFRLDAKLERQGSWPKSHDGDSPSTASPWFSPYPLSATDKLRAEASLKSAASKDWSLERVKQDVQLSSSQVEEILRKLEPTEQQHKDDDETRLNDNKSSKRKHKKKSRRSTPNTPSTQNTSTSSIASHFSESMIRVAGESGIHARMKQHQHHGSSSSTALTDMFSWGHSESHLAGGASPVKLKKKKSTRRQKSTHMKGATPSTSHHHDRKKAPPVVFPRSRLGPMWQGDDERSLASLRSRPAPMWQDDDTVVSSSLRSRVAPIWQGNGDTSSSLISQRSRPAPIWREDIEASPAKSPGRQVVLKPKPLRASRPAPLVVQEDATVSTCDTMRSRPAPMWREEDTKSTRTLHITNASPRPPEKDYRQFFEDLAASYRDDLLIVEQHSMSREALVTTEYESPREEDDEPPQKQDFHQLFHDLSDSNELVFQDARTYAKNWTCGSPSPASVESSVSDESAQDAIQFSESLEQSIQSESVSNSKGSNSVAKRFVHRFTGRTVFRGPSVKMASKD